VQCIATGETSTGDVPKNIVADMVPLLDDPAISDYDKARLLMLYIIDKEGVSDEDRRKLLDHAKLNSKLRGAMTNMALLGVRLTKVKSPVKNGVLDYLLDRFQAVDAKEKPKKKKNKVKSDEEAYELSRYIGHVKTMIEV
jgi:syntaxin-binding protein 1